MGVAFLRVQAGFQARVEQVGYAIGEALGLDVAPDGGAEDARAPEAAMARKAAPDLFAPMELATLAQGLSMGNGGRELVRHLAGTPEGLRRAVAIAGEAGSEEVALRLGEAMADAALGLSADGRLDFVGPGSFGGGGNQGLRWMAWAVERSLGVYRTACGLDPFAPLVPLGFPVEVARAAFGEGAEDVGGLATLLVASVEGKVGKPFCTGDLGATSEMAAHLGGSLALLGEPCGGTDGLAGIRGVLEKGGWLDRVSASPS